MFQYNSKDKLLLHKEGAPGNTGLVEGAPDNRYDFSKWETELKEPGPDGQLVIPGVDEGSNPDNDDFAKREDEFTQEPNPTLPEMPQAGAGPEGGQESKERRGSKLLRNIGSAALGLAKWNNNRKSTKESVGNTVSKSVADSKIIALAAKKSRGKMWNFAKKVGNRIKSDTSAGVEFARAAVITTAEAAKARREQSRKNKINDMIDRRRAYLKGREGDLTARIDQLINERDSLTRERLKLPQPE